MSAKTNTTEFSNPTLNIFRHLPVYHDKVIKFRNQNFMLHPAFQNQYLTS